MRDVFEQFAGPLISIEDLFDGLGEIIFGITKFHVYADLTSRLDLNEITKTEYLKLVTILDQDIEIGINNRCLILAGELEGHRLDAVLFIGLPLQFRMLQGIDEFHPHSAFSSHRIFFQQVTQARHQRCQEWMGLGTEIPPDDHWLPQLRQVTSGGFGDGVDVSLSQIGPNPTHWSKP